jgi:hypothetical protein
MGKEAGKDRAVSDEHTEAKIDYHTLAAWRAELASIRSDERQRAVPLSPETGRLLEIVGQVLAQGGGMLPRDDVARIKEVISANAADG